MLHNMIVFVEFRKVVLSGIGRGFLRTEVAEEIRVVELNGETAFGSLRLTSR